jgi:hypothetical protein
MGENVHWLSLDKDVKLRLVDGLVAVSGYEATPDQPEQAAVMMKAKDYGADAVFFEACRNGRPPVPQAFVFISDGPADDPSFGELHRRLWSWGGVPLVYRKTQGLVQLFRCAHGPDFISPSGEKCNPFKTLNILGKISDDPWWDHWRLRNGTIWDDPKICGQLMSNRSAHKLLLNAVKELHDELNQEGILKKHLRRKLLILSLLIAYLEERSVLLPEYFGKFLPGAAKFFQVLADGEALIALLEALEVKFNGNVFRLTPEDAESLRNNGQLARFARMVEAKQEKTGQRTLWELYSFKDLPIELISHIYQMFVEDKDTAIYTPPFLVRLMLDEALSWERLDRLHEREQIIADFSCGSGVFLVEAYKRLVLHWRSRNNWKQPGKSVLNRLLKKVHGIDLEKGAVELTAFSLYLAMCDALEPEEIRSSIRLFPPLEGVTLHQLCFFEAKQKGAIKAPIGVVVGNPPFKSKLTTPGAKESYADYEKQHGKASLPDKQLGYLFLNDGMEMVADGGVLCMLQQYGFLYNQQTFDFRRRFIEKWDMREVLDFISVRGLFQKGDADTKVVVVVAENDKPPRGRKILHGTFRRTGRVDAEKGFDIDYYDLHWLPRELVLSNDGVWRSDLLGGGRVLGFVDRLKRYQTLGQYAEDQQRENGWDFGEGFVEGQKGISRPADHIIGKPNLPSEALTADRIDLDAIIGKFPKRPIEGPRSEKRFSPPMLLVREQMDLPHAVWKGDYLTYKNQIVGFSAPANHSKDLDELDKWLSEQATTLRAFVAGVSVKLFTQKATTLSGVDILALPYPETRTLDLSSHERIVVSDIVEFCRDLVRLGEKSRAMKNSAKPSLSEFVRIFTCQINAIYKKNSLRALDPQIWPGIICQPFVFGNGNVDWADADSLQGKLDNLLQEQKGSSLHVTRIARIYDGRFIFMLKPDRLRFWLRSIALRDADEVLADLRAQGF